MSPIPKKSGKELFFLITGTLKINFFLQICKFLLLLYFKGNVFAIKEIWETNFFFQNEPYCFDLEKEKNIPSFSSFFALKKSKIHFCLAQAPKRGFNNFVGPFRVRVKFVGGSLKSNISK